jgi:leucyl aminopeptidase
MPTPQVIASSTEVADQPCDALVVGSFSDDGVGSLKLPVPGLDSAFAEHLSRAMADAGFKGTVGSVLIVPTLGMAGARAIAVVGLGQQGQASARHVRRAAAAAARQLAERAEVASVLHCAVEGTSEAAAEGFLLGSYRFGKYKSDPRPPKLKNIKLVDAPTKDVEHGAVLAEATILARDLINEPPVSLTPRMFAAKARELADVNGLQYEELDETELEERGFGGVIGVAKGSSEPPRLIHLRYAGSNAASKLALVGKGVTFDSGGLSLKASQSMMEMKTDMSGGAAVVGAMGALARLGPAVEVDAYVPVVENMPSGTSLKPGDVIRHYGGRTTEVLNTDAEGRLILADALALASESKPAAIVDVATLTGSIAIALGAKIGGLFCTSEELRDQLLSAADASGETLWPMPLFDEYRSEIDSSVADNKNVGSRFGGAIIAALFLRSFIGSEIPWAHLDIAGAARSDKDQEEISRGGTGITTRTLIRWVESQAG